MGLNRMRDSQGVSLVEVMIALLVLLLVFMGLLQAALLGIDSNMRNVLRDEAVTVAAMRMEEARSIPFDNVVDDPNVCSETGNLCTTDDDCAGAETCGTPATASLPSCVQTVYPIRTNRNFRSIVDFPFGTEITVAPMGTDGNTSQITVEVAWEYKNECYTHNATTLRRR